MSAGTASSRTITIAALAFAIGTRAAAMARTIACIATPASKDAAANAASTGAPNRVGPSGAPSHALPNPIATSATTADASGRAPGTSIARTAPPTASAVSTTPISALRNDAGDPPCESPRSPAHPSSSAAPSGTPAARTRSTARSHGASPTSTATAMSDRALATGERERLPRRGARREERGAAAPAHAPTRGS